MSEDIEFAPHLPTVEYQPDWVERLIIASELLAQPDPGPTPMLVEDLIVDGAIVAAAGRWKTTKSYLLADLAISVATGHPLFGKLGVPNPGPVVYVCEESGKTAFHRRLSALCRGRAVNPDELDQLYLSANERVKLDDARWQNEILELTKPYCSGPPIRLAIFDPLARMTRPDRDENAKAGMAEVIEFLRLLRDEMNGGTVLFVHHTGHQGDHMRGTSDLESAWETKLTWKRDGQSPLVTVTPEHREVEAGDPISYRIVWDGDTRSMRFNLETDPLEEAVRAYIRDHPDASANEVDEHVDGNRKKILALVKTIREGGSETLEPPRNHPRQAPPVSGSPAPSYRRAGTTTRAPGSNGAEPPANGHVDQVEVERLRALFLDTEPEPLEEPAA